MSNKQLRDIIRILHIITGVMLIVFVYSSSLRENAVYAGLLQFVVIPAVSVTGLAMWQQARINKWRKRTAS